MHAFSNGFLTTRKRNKDKCYILMRKDKSAEIHIGETIIKISDFEKLLGIKIDSKLHFDDHV